MKLLLICKGEYRYFFPAIARALRERHGADVSAIAFTAAATSALRKTSAFSSIFNLAAFLKRLAPSLPSASHIETLSTLETLPGAPKINTMIYADRILSRYPHRKILRALAAISQFWDETLSVIEPDAILGEVACAAEWIGWLKARRRDIPYLIPSATPVAKRFYFLDAPVGNWQRMQAAFEELEDRKLPPGKTAAATEFISAFRTANIKPPFLDWAQSSPLRPELSRFLRRLRRIPFRLRSYIEDGQFEVGSYHGTPPWKPAIEDIERIARHALAETTLLSRNIRSERPYVYFPLHVQPEFTTEVRAPFFTNQIALIESISKSLPVGYELFVKEHPGMKGERALSDYRALNKMFNVRLLSPSVDSHDLIRRCAAVLTITGSSAWEAILYEKPVIAFGPLYYGFSGLAYRCESLADLPAILSDAMFRFVPNRAHLLKFVAAFLATAHHVQWGDPVRQPEITKRHNTEKIADALVAELASRTSTRTSLTLVSARI